MNQILSDESMLEQFEQFKSNKLDPTQRNEFSEKLNSNPEFKQAYQIFLLSYEVIEEKISQDLKSDLNLWKDEERRKDVTPGTVIPLNPGKQKRSSWIYKIAVAASLLLVLSFGFIKYREVKNYPTIAISNSQGIDNLTLRGDNNITRVDVILQEYKDDKKSIDQTIASLQTISIDEPNLGYYKAQNSIGRLYLQQGNCEAMSSAYQNAAVLTSYKFDGEIGKVLCALKNRADEKEISTLLKPIVDNPDNSYFDEAKKIEKKIQSFWWKLFN